MTACDVSESADIELYFYDELDDIRRASIGAHARVCPECRQRLDDLHAIRAALAAEPGVDAPPAGDWSGFMRRLDENVGLRHASRQPTVDLKRAGATWRVRQLIVVAATLAVVATGVFMAARFREQHGTGVASSVSSVAAPQVTARGSGAVRETAPVKGSASDLTPAAALREVSAEHLERSKLVVLNLAARDPQTTRPSDWQYERKLAGSLLPDTRLYRLAAQERGVSDVAHVMRDLETVLLEASMSDATDRESLERVQRLIARRGLVTKMQMVATSAGL